MKESADYYQKLLDLQPHPEGGEYAVYYRSPDNIKILNDRYGPGNVFRLEGTSIYYLLRHKQFSAFHELKSPEIWHYYAGNTPINLYIIQKDGTLISKLSGSPAITPGASFQIAIEANQIFGGNLQNDSKDSFALIGCTVSPGFTFEDFTIHSRQHLLTKYPQHSDIINKLTKNSC